MAEPIIDAGEASLSPMDTLSGLREEIQFDRDELDAMRDESKRAWS